MTNSIRINDYRFTKLQNGLVQVFDFRTNMTGAYYADRRLHSGQVTPSPMYLSMGFKALGL